MDKLDIKVRPIASNDISFIYNSWLKSYYEGSYFCKRIKSSIYYEFHHKVIENILNRPTTVVLVACDPLDENIIYGYLAAQKYNEDTIIQYTYVKEAFRGLGVLKELLKACELDPNECLFSHWTQPVNELIKKYPDMVYVPYLV